MNNNYEFDETGDLTDTVVSECGYIDIFVYVVTIWSLNDNFLCKILKVMDHIFFFLNS